ncbi:MmcQ/YjbR family DNA-binding protein [Bradyrhizobium genosp. L]|uniref:MmcQ/YjbR family DNA-binding protein n=1 Tax=Bradyrhizobium genosp. L TaxID=83637 RepID=UPI0018A2FA25|nr:MmcQ/YjbR family DNA-binding protein [Bradyrhizobium genosp. L]QPF86395.1 MmcQ/YjbR family DNA-binding protein [Bradyrhizobium genosp. L]
MSQARFRKIALSLPDAVEGAHRGHADFRVGTRIFATLGYPDADWGMVKLTPEQQAMVVEAEPEIFRPVPGGWGKGGSTNVRLAKADPATLRSALTMARDNITARPAKKAPVKNARAKKSS